MRSEAGQIEDLLGINLVWKDGNGYWRGSFVQAANNGYRFTVSESALGLHKNYTWKIYREPHDRDGWDVAESTHGFETVELAMEDAERYGREHRYF